MTTTPQSSPPATSSTPRRRARAAAVGGAVLATGVLWLAAQVLGIELRVGTRSEPPTMLVSLGLTITFTLVFALLGWGTLALLERFTSRARTVWTALAAAVLLLSFAAPLTDQVASGGTKAILTLMHVAVAAALVPVMRRG